MKDPANLDPQSAAKKERRMGRFQRSFVWLLSGLMVLVPCLFAWYLLRNYFQAELEFRRHGTFLNFEQAGYRLTEQIKKITRINLESQTEGLIVTTPAEPRAILKMEANGVHLSQGQLPLSWQESITPQLALWRDGEVYVWFLAGEGLILKHLDVHVPVRWNQSELAVGRYVLVWALPRDITSELTSLSQGQMWLMNTHSDIVFHSDGSVARADLIKDPLVQKYIQSPLTRFETYLNEDGTEAYGFAMHVPDSNLLLFARMPLSLWTSPILTTIFKASGILLIGILLMGIVVRSFIANLRLQSQTLAKHLEDFAQGYFIPPELGDLKLYQELEPVREAILFSTKRVRDRLTRLEQDRMEP
jgi:hypothetical protein